MELVKKNIHMDRIKCKASTQITLEDDCNVPDSKPDVERLILDKGEIRVEEMKASQDHVSVRGKLCFKILYRTQEDRESLCCMENNIPFEEQIHMEGVENGDPLSVQWLLEDMKVSMINSRKCNVQAVASLSLSVEELYDEEAAVELYAEEPVESRKRLASLAEIAVRKKDIFRLKEELEVPRDYPNIFQILWDDISLSEVEFVPKEEKLSIQGELQIFLLYEGDSEERPVKWYEKSVPFGGTVECHDCREDMIADISCQLSHGEVEIKEDFDGEERIFGVDIVLDLDIKLYQEEQVDMLADVYGVTREVQPVTRQGCYNTLLTRTDGRMKLAERGKLPSGAPSVRQICHCSAKIMTDSVMATENGVEISGTVAVEALYLTGEEPSFASWHQEFPFQYTLEAEGITEKCRYETVPSVEQLSVSALDNEELDVKAVLQFKMIVFDCVAQDIITDIDVREIDMEARRELPGIVAYIARDGDNLWQLGKKYYVPMDQIRETNHLTGDELKTGDKILIVR